MFTGIGDHCGTVSRLEKGSGAMGLGIRSSFTDVTLGESIAVDGVCLTALTTGAEELSFDVSPETLRLSRLGTIGLGAKVNLERALRFSDRLGGHLVTG